MRAEELWIIVIGSLTFGCILGFATHDYKWLLVGYTGMAVLLVGIRWKVKSESPVGGDFEGKRYTQHEKKTAVPETTPSGSIAQLRKTDEVIAAVEEIAPELPPLFTQSDVVDCLTEHGYEVNRSTLRVSLISMAESGVLFKVSELGKGRRATIFANKCRHFNRVRVT